MKKLPPILILLLPLLIAVTVVWAPLYLLWRVTSGAVLRAWFRKRHAARGRTVMFVYSNSPNWQAYVEANILPRLGARAVVLNWSERRHWRRGSRWDVWFFERFAGDREFNPAALVYRPDGEIEVIRFHQPFLDLKHGRDGPLRAAEAALLARLSA
jgi:hypothetical protein